MNCFDAYQKYFSIDPHQEMSLPSIAMKAMFKNFSNDSPLVYSFDDRNKDIADIFRARVFGGLTNVYHRHVRLFDSPEEIAFRAKYSENGSRYSAIIRICFSNKPFY